MLTILYFLDNNTICKVGDGSGGNETQLLGSYTIKECLVAVKEKYPMTNGATMEAHANVGQNLVWKLGLAKNINLASSLKRVSCIYGQEIIAVFKPIYTSTVLFRNFYLIIFICPFKKECGK